MKFDPNHEGARLQAANHQPLPVEGVVILEVTFQGTNQTTLMNCLVSSDLNHEIFISWYDAMKVGAIWIHGADVAEEPYIRSVITKPTEKEEFIREQIRLINSEGTVNFCHKIHLQECPKGHLTRRRVLSLLSFLIISV